MSTILFYSPFNQRSRDTESLMLAFCKQGHRVISLSQQEGKDIHPFLQTQGIETFCNIVSGRFTWLNHIRRVMFLIRFCRKRKVDVVYSHLEPANFVASIAQYFVGAKVYLCRHHSDQYALLKTDRDLSYRVTYFLAKRIIVVSQANVTYMQRHERIASEKILKINLAYDFTLYPEINWDNVRRIKAELTSRVILITVGHLNALKRPDQSIHILHKLRLSGFDAKLVLLGKGELEKELRMLAQDLEMESYVFFGGYVNNVLEYIAASTILLHPSVSESSCVVVKEAGLVNVPVIACEHVGDFDDYIQNGSNGFLFSKERYSELSVPLIAELVTNEPKRIQMGSQLNKDVHKNFSIDNILPMYDNINSMAR